MPYPILRLQPVIIAYGLPKIHKSSMPSLSCVYTVFNRELNEGLEVSHETARDQDEYDAGCHHLMVLEKNSNQVIGTYRMQTSDMAKEHAGFYSAAEFDLSQFPSRFFDHSIELGRACVAREYRNGRVLYLLWRGLAQYMVMNKKRYFFGCCSLSSQDPSEGKRVMKFLIENHYVHPTLRIKPQPGFECYDATVAVDETQPVKIPQLMQLYLSHGAKICSLPAMDRIFKTIDYLAVLDEKNISEHARKLFF